MGSKRAQINNGLGRRVNFEDAGLNDLYDKALLVIKNVQNPQRGTIPASTSPFIYRNNCVRDGCLTAMALDASGHPPEAEQYWRWMAAAQKPDGTWGTTYYPWSGEEKPFVEPEYDSLGQFLYGVYRHYENTRDEAFLTALWPAIKLSADWIVSNISGSGFSAPDYSIWEETDKCSSPGPCEYNVFTQAWYVAGLNAMQGLALSKGDRALADWYAGGVAAIMTAIQRSSDVEPLGLWNPLGYYNRAITTGQRVLTLQDSSSNILITLGIIDAESDRASRHITMLKTSLNQDGDGISRYKGDIYYYSSPYDPAGDEVGAPDPAWPQMAAWVAVCETFREERVEALARLKWIVKISGKGYMPHGEAVSSLTHGPVPSSMCEPLTGSSFVLAALIYEGQYDLRISVPGYHAGCYKQIEIVDAPDNWTQWRNVPYFTGRQGHRSSAELGTTIKRVYLSNDEDHLYIRIDNSAVFSPFWDGTSICASCVC